MTKSEATTPAYTSSDETEVTPPADRLIAMGKKLVDELNIDRPDTLSQWMAHHVADLMQKAEEASNDTKIALQKDCFDTILKLWAHRATLPDGKRPFESYEAVLRALESLDPDNVEPRYHRRILALFPGADVTPEPVVQSLFETIQLVDNAARITIGHLLAQAADATTEKDREWIALAQDAADDGGVHILIVRYLAKVDGGGDPPDEQVEGRRAVLNDRVQRLRKLISASEKVVADLTAELQSIPPAPPVDDIEEHL